MRYEKTRELRKRFDVAGIEYRKGYRIADRGINKDDTTHVGDVTFEEDEGGELSAFGLSIEQIVRAIRPKAECVNVSTGVTGHCECEACGKPIDPSDKFCRKCGAELFGGW